MNERIKELAEQAEKWICTTNFEGMPEDNMTYDELYNKKFAELIVRECARPLILLGREMDKDAEFYKYHSKEVIATHMYIRLEKHFGVE